MTKLNIDIGEVIQRIRTLKRQTDELELGYRKLSIRYEELGLSWRDSEYKHIEGYLDQANTIIAKYKKDNEDYLDYTLFMLQKLMREYTEGGSIGEVSLEGIKLELDDLEGGTIGVEEIVKSRNKIVI